MGDSITEFWGLAVPAMFGPDVVDRGISGQTTPQMLTRFMQDVVDLKPAVVHILGGTNLSSMPGFDSLPPRARPN
jgi:lysophospholipase L1-like esterase